MESESQHIGEILPAVMANIKARMDQQRKSQHRHQSRVIAATRDFLAGKQPKKQFAKKETAFPDRQGNFLTTRDD